jgi:hypothetical protein
MAYQIIKGWPCEGAIDMNIAVATDELVADGVGCVVDSDSKAAVANFAVDGSDATGIPGFCIGIDNVTGNALLLLSEAMIQVDSDHYEVASYTPGAGVSFVGGKFDLIAAIDDERPQVGTVFSYDASATELVVFFGKVTEATATTPSGP